jgi:sialate O-acetylesterase
MGRPVAQWLCVALLVPLCGGFSRAAIEPVCWFGDNMVLQREKPAPVWGWADPGETVTVKVAGRSASTTAGKDGYWKAVLAPLEPGGPHDLEISGRTDKKVIKNVLIGDVWICGGQSNMWRPFIQVDANTPETEWRLRPGPDVAHYPAESRGLEQIRLFHIGHNGSRDLVLDIPRQDTWGPFERTRMNRDICPQSWRVCTRESLRNFSRLGFFFGQAIQREIGVPIGLICVAMGSTSVNQWTSTEVLDKLLMTTSAPPQTVRFKRTGGSGRADLFNGMVHPMLGLAIEGFIWWQGEADAIDKAGCDIDAYPRGTFKEMIHDYRRRWGQGDFPFLFVQLQNHFPRGKGMSVRDYQMQALELPHAAMVVSLDIAAGIHPLNKHDVSKRLVHAALAVAYGHTAPYSGPIYSSATVEGSEIRIEFKHVGGGLTVGTGLFNKKQEELSNAGDRNAPFEIRAVDGPWVKAHAKIDRDTVAVWAPGIEHPRFAAYAMSRVDPENTVLKTTLFNREGFPASPFDTQTWGGLKGE